MRVYVLKPEDQPSQAMAQIIQQCYDAPRLAPQLLTA
jgi:hypothetical protein